MQELRDSVGRLMGDGLKKPIIPRSEIGTVSSASECSSALGGYYDLLLRCVLSAESDPEAVHLGAAFVVEWPSPFTRLSVRVKLNKSANSDQFLGSFTFRSTARRAFITPISLMSRL